MKPTVGRIVHYYDAKIGLTDGSGPFAAIVTGVENDNRVSLTVFVPGSIDVMSVLDVPDNDTPIKAGTPYWRWPPRE